MSRLRADVLLACSLPLLLLAGVLPWQVDRICTYAGCGDVHTTAWNGSPAWAVPLILAIAVAGGWLLLLPDRPAPTGVAALAAAVGGLGAMAVVTTLDALVFNRAGFFPFRLPVDEDFPVLSVRPGIGLPLGLLGLIGLAAAGWLTVRARNALVTPWRPPRRPTGPGPARVPPLGPVPGAGPMPGIGSAPGIAPGAESVPTAHGMAQGPPPPRAGGTREGTRSGHRRSRHR